MSSKKEDTTFQKIVKGPSLGYSDNFPKREMWKEIAKELNGEFKIRYNSGHELEIHNKYLIKSNRSDLTKKIISEKIQKVLLKYNVYSVSYQTDSKSQTAELISVIQRDAGDKKMILELIDMYKLLIDNLVRSRVIK